MTVCLAVATAKEYRAAFGPLGAPAAPAAGATVTGAGAAVTGDCS